MNKAYFEILRAGVNTTIQDKGRNHLYHVGIAEVVQLTREITYYQIDWLIIN